MRNTRKRGILPCKKQYLYFWSLFFISLTMNDIQYLISRLDVLMCYKDSLLLTCN